MQPLGSNDKRCNCHNDSPYRKHCVYDGVIDTRVTNDCTVQVQSTYITTSDACKNVLTASERSRTTLPKQERSACFSSLLKIDVGPNLAYTQIGAVTRSVMCIRHVTCIGPKCGYRGDRRKTSTTTEVTACMYGFYISQSQHWPPTARK